MVFVGMGTSLHRLCRFEWVYGLCMLCGFRQVIKWVIKQVMHQENVGACEVASKHAAFFVYLNLLYV